MTTIPAGERPLVLVLQIGQRLASVPRWEVFLGAFADLVRRFNTAGDGTARIESEYFVVSVGP